MAIGVPFKLKTSDSDFQDFSSTEENYLAFEVGRQYSIYDSSKGGSLGFDSSGGRIVGTLTNTSYDSSIGAHVNVTLSTTSTNIYQNLSTADSVGASLHRIPIYQNDSSGQFVIREFNDSDRNTLADRLNSRIFASDYPGSYKLGSSAPSGDYAVALSNVMTDTRSGDSSGNTVQFNIYQRKTMTSPTQTLPFAVKRASGDSGTYQGLQLMTDSQIGHSLAEIGRNRITGGDSNGDYQIGSYLIRSSAQGAPTSTGTWVAKGTATDTRLVATDTNFTNSSTGVRAVAFSGNFTDNFTDNFTSNFTDNFTSESTSNFTNNFTNTFSQDFINTTTVNFTGESTQAFTRNSQRTSTRNSTNTFTRNSTQNFSGTQNFFTSYFYSRSSGSEYYFGTTGGNNTWYWNGTEIASGPSGFVPSGTFDNTSVDGYFYEQGTYQEAVTSSFPGGSVTTFYYNIRRYDQGSVNFTGDFTGNFTGDFIGNYTGDFIGNYTGNFIGDFTGNFSQTFTGNFTGDFTGDYTGNFIGDFTGDFTGDYTGDFTGDYIGVDFTGDFTTDFTGDFIGTLIGDTSTNIETFTLYVRTA